VAFVDDDKFPLKFGEELSVVHDDFITCNDNREFVRRLSSREVLLTKTFTSRFIAVI
jgi:hypothetical protein